MSTQETKRQRADRLLCEKITAVTDEWDRIRLTLTPQETDRETDD